MVFTPGQRLAYPAALLLAFAVCPAAHAYVLQTTNGNPRHWTDADTSSPATININYDFRDVERFSDGVTFTNVLTPAQQAMYEQALADWTTLSGGKLVFTRSTTLPYTQILTLSVGDLAANEGTSGPGGTLGIEQPSVFPDGRIAQAQVQLDSAETWDLTIGNGKPANTSDFYSVALHEIGHALGLDHSQSFPGNIMTTSLTGEKLGAAQDDIDGIAANYSFNPVPSYTAISRTLPNFLATVDGQYNAASGSPTVFEYYTNTGVTTITGAMSVGASGFINTFTFRQSGGIWNANSGISVGNTSNGPGLVELSAGSLTTTSITLFNTGSLSLTGGLLNATAITRNGTGVFNWTGGTLSLTGAGALSGLNGIVVPAGGALVTTARYALPDLTINGTATLLASATGSTASKVTSLAIAGGINSWTGKLDLTTNSLIVQPISNRAGTIETLANQIVSGKAAHWSGNGITASSLAALPNSTLALVDNADLGLATFGGQSVNADSIIITRAILGDADLSGNVDLGDFDRWFTHVSANTYSYAAGDFNLTGIVDLGDFDIWLSHVGVNGLSVRGAAAAAPEPASLGVLGVALLGMAGRRRRVNRWGRSG